MVMVQNDCAISSENANAYRPENNNESDQYDSCSACHGTDNRSTPLLVFVYDWGSIE